MYKYFLLLFLIFISCNNLQSNVQTTKWDKDNIRQINVSDSNYLHALKETQESLPVFLSAFDAKDTSLSFFIKSKFMQGELIEHMWLRLIKHGNDSFISILDNVPNRIDNVKLGDTLIIRNGDVEDVTIYHGDTILFGDFINKRNE